MLEGRKFTIKRNKEIINILKVFSLNVSRTFANVLINEGFLYKMFPNIFINLSIGMEKFFFPYQPEKKNVS